MRIFKFVLAICFLMLMCIMISCKECKCTGFCFQCSCDDKDCHCTEKLPEEFAKTSWSLQETNTRFLFVKLEVNAEKMKLTYAFVSGLSKRIEDIGEFVFEFKYQFEPKTGFFQSVENNNYDINGNLIDNSSLYINLPTGDKVTLTR